MRDAYRWLSGVWLPAPGHGAGGAPGFKAYHNVPGGAPPTKRWADIHQPLAPS